MSKPFITDPRHLKEVEGQQFIVLRPTGDVESTWSSALTTLKPWLPSSASHPNAGHVTLRGFGVPQSSQQLEASLRDWSSNTEPLKVSIERIDFFDVPFQITILRVESTEQLRNAYSELTDVIRRDAINTVGIQRPADEWIFHMSLAYCGNCTLEEWTAVKNQAKSFDIGNPTCLVAEAELVIYDDGEHRTSLKLGTAGRR